MDPHSLHQFWDDNITASKGSEWSKVVPWLPELKYYHPYCRRSDVESKEGERRATKQ